MAENPLLPNDQLRALLALTKDCARLDSAADRAATEAQAGKRKGHSGSVWTSREALIAGTLLNLQPGDVLLPEPSDAVSLRLLPTSNPGESARTPIPAWLDRDLRGKTPRLLLGTAIAAAFRAARSDRIVVVHCSPGSAEENWSSALRWAQEDLLPFIVVCGDGRGSEAFRSGSRSGQSASAWDAVQRTAARCQLPVLSVDGEDAVAVYRVTQESVLRARSGGGPALLWAMLPSAREVNASNRPAALKPVARLRRYLRARQIPEQAS